MRWITQNHRQAYRTFIQSCLEKVGQARLTPNSQISPYALCFAIFGLELLKDADYIETNKFILDKTLRNNLLTFRDQRKLQCMLARDKPFMQLLTFTLSALAILNTLESNPMAELIEPLLPSNIEKELRDMGVFLGKARSGNQAMFIGILLIHASKYMGLNKKAQIENWVALHLDSMNQFGFWGRASSMSHLQFQNGYHQYELFEYLDVDATPWRLAANSTSMLADSEGRFAPYPGGGGCYDYDAVFLLTGNHQGGNEPNFDILHKTAASIVGSQNPDGGFCESRYVRPRNLKNIHRTIKHIVSAKGRARYERIRQAVALSRPKNNRIHTHWTSYSRRWDESDLWDSWFRMLALARIEVAHDSTAISDWGFIDYPGIGYHPRLTELGSI